MFLLWSYNSLFNADFAFIQIYGSDSPQNFLNPKHKFTVSVYDILLKMLSLVRVMVMSLEGQHIGSTFALTSSRLVTLLVTLNISTGLMQPCSSFLML